MSERPDPRQISGRLRAALDQYDKAQLADMLVHVFRDYVLEGAPPLRVSGSADEEIDALGSLGFVDLIAQLKARLDLPELDLLRIENGRVWVATGDGLVPLAVGGAAEAVSPTAVEPAAGVGPSPASASSQPSPPRAPAPPAAPPASSPAATAPPPTPPAASPPSDKPADEPPAGDDDASIRFSLLELD